MKTGRGYTRTCLHTRTRGLKLLLMALLTGLGMMLLPATAYAATVDVSGGDGNAVSKLAEAFSRGNDVRLTGNVSIPANTQLAIGDKARVALDVNGYTLTLESGAGLTVTGSLTLKNAAGDKGGVQLRNGARLSAVVGGLKLDGAAVTRESGSKIFYSVATSSNAAPMEVEQEKIITNLNLPASQQMEKGAELEMKTQFQPSSTYPAAAAAQRTWSSSDLSVASVEASTGRVKALKAGTAVITVRFDDFPTITSQTTITVVDTSVTGITLSEQQFNLKAGEEKQLTASLTAGQDATEQQKKVTWTSDNPAAATVDGNGRVKGIAPGVAWIKASVGSGSQIKSASCKVIVYESVIGSVDMTPVLEVSQDTAAGKVAVKMPYDIYSDFPKETKINVTVLLPTSTINNVIAQTSAKEIRVEIQISKEVDERANVNIVNIKAGEEIFQKLKEKNKNIVFEVRKENGGTLVSSWSFTGSQITKAVDMNLHLDLLKTTDVTAIKRLASNNSRTAVLRFGQDGNFPGRAKLTVGLNDTVFAKNNSLYLYFFNENRGRLEYMGSVSKVDANLTTTMTLSKGGQYLISRTKQGTSADDDDDDEEETPRETGRWVQNNVGWWYRNSNGSYPVNKWQQIGGKWYLFDVNGYMLTGWQLRNGVWYYLQPSGEMVENNWVQSGGRWYFLKDGGAMATGWQLWKNKWYFLSSPNGEMVANNWLFINNQWFYVGGDGAMFSNQWLYSNDKWYFLQSDGSMAFGWIKWKDNWYYLNYPNGDMAVNTTLPGGYRVGPSGAMY